MQTQLSVRQTSQRGVVRGFSGFCFSLCVKYESESAFQSAASPQFSPRSSVTLAEPQDPDLLRQGQTGCNHGDQAAQSVGVQVDHVQT